MTTFREEERTCAVCGYVAWHTVLTSTSAFGDVDLDTRPPPPARMALALQIQCCPACGYCAPNIEVMPDVAPSVVAQEAYRAQRNDPSFPYLANMFLCWGMIQVVAGEYAGAGWAAVRAAWACDDEGAEYASAAVTCRLRAVEWFVAGRERGQSFATEAEVEEALLADLLRRSARFDEAEAAIARGLSLNPSETVRRVLLFQRRLCQARDTALHTVGEISD